MNMKRSLIITTTILLVCLMLADDHLATPQPPKKGGRLPPISLPVPESKEEKDYLGLSGGSSFRVQSIKARVVIIEIFSLYCPPCLKMGPVLKDLYQRIENNTALREKIKLIGIGAGNSLHEVEKFREATEAPFPLFPDKDFTIHNALGEVRTPYFIAIRIHDGGTHRVIYSERGGFNEAQTFLDSILAASRLK